MLFDTHAHYDLKQFDNDRETVLPSLEQAGVGLVLNPSTDLASGKKVLALCDTYPFIFGAVGVHPHDVESCGNETISGLEIMTRHPKVKAIGEIGLDYHYNFVPREIQKVWFEQQMDLAQQLDIPVIIHDREAHADTLHIVKKFPRVRGVYHCYSGSLEYAKVIVGLGYSISFTGTVTYKNAKHLPEVAAWLPDDRIFIETDAPYLSPEPVRGKRCDSAFLKYTAEKIAGLRGVSFERFSETSTRNGKLFFSID